MLRSIAVDEERHAALSQAVVDWGFAIAPDAARVALADLPPREPAPQRPYDRALARFGVPSPEASAAAFGSCQTRAI